MGEFRECPAESDGSVRVRLRWCVVCWKLHWSLWSVQRSPQVPGGWETVSSESGSLPSDEMLDDRLLSLIRNAYQEAHEIAMAADEARHPRLF